MQFIPTTINGFHWYTLLPDWLTKREYLFSRDEFTLGYNKKRKIFNSDLPGLRLIKINKMPTES
jgi:hypothetical protein